MDMKRLGGYVLGLYAAMFDDIAVEYPSTHKDLKRDYKRISSAVDQHGIQFALITMPDYRKHLDQCLDSGRLTKSGMIHFGSYRSRGTIPRLFKGLFLRVFDDSGCLRSNPDARAIFWLRQLLGAVRKLKLACPDSAVFNETKEFFLTDSAVARPSVNWDDVTEAFPSDRSLHMGDIDEEEVCSLPLFDQAESETRPSIPNGLSHTLQTVSDILVGSLGRFDVQGWRARHGPGVVSDLKGGNKYSFPFWPDKLEYVFPYDVMGVSSHNALGEMSGHDGSGGIDYRFHSEPPGRLLSVPKTLKGPRLIASEPTSHQWCQQVIRDYLMTSVSSTIAGSFIDFFDQRKSGRMVQRASIDGSLATIDLKAASDRISCWLVERVFRSRPELLEAFRAVRTRWICQDLDPYLPRFSRLRKFSTMGSALTFPVQSIVFTAFAIGCTLYNQGLAPTIHNIRKLRGSVRVFGDDIIIPVGGLGLLGSTLEAYGLKVNVAKTFGTGRFRESCGEDCFGGYSVTTVAINELPRKSAPGSVASAVDTHNNLLAKGLVNTASFVRRTVDHLRGYHIPEVRPDSGAFGWNSYDVLRNDRFKRRWNEGLHRLEIRIHRARAQVDRVLPEGFPVMLQYFTEASKGVTSSAKSTLGYSNGRPRLSLTPGWAALPM
jgi:hypothetical protein